jgi:hypothetical protein
VLFDNATKAAILKLLNSDIHQEKDTALNLFLLAAKYGKPVDFRPSKHAHMRTEELRAGLFDNTTIAAIPKLLNSDSTRARDIAVELVSFAANHGELVDCTLWRVLTSV